MSTREAHTTQNPEPTQNHTSSQASTPAEAPAEGANPLSGRLVVVRHGQTDWNREGRMQGSTDIPLNDTGRGQAKEAAAALRELSREGEDWELIAASPLGRADETARIIAAELGLGAVQTVPGIVERAYGEAEGLVLSYRQSRRPDQQYAGVEPEAEVYRRGVAALQELVRQNPGCRLIAVSHGSLIRRVLKATTPGDWEDGIPNATPLEVDLEGLLSWGPERLGEPGQGL